MSKREAQKWMFACLAGFVVTFLLKENLALLSQEWDPIFFGKELWDSDISYNFFDNRWASTICAVAALYFGYRVLVSEQ